MSPSKPDDSSEHVHHYGRDVAAELSPLGRALRTEIPEVYRASSELNAAAMKAGALDEVTKELIAFAIAITEHCDGCIAAHARGAAKKGATRAQVAEMIGVTIMMNGGPAKVYGPRALAAYDDFAATD